MGDEMLTSVCELAFEVAKEGNAPSAMKNFLYLAQRPPRAYSVAQRSLEEDAEFRARVAERATVETVGEGGYLWLHRPAGWEQRFAALDVSTVSAEESASADASPAETSGANEAPAAQTPATQTPATQTPATQTPATQTPATQTPATQTPATQIPADADGDDAVSSSSNAPRAPKPVRTAGAAPTVSSIENELSSLRGLVDRLADERQNVRSSVSELEVELETRRAENIAMSARLSSLRTELDSVQSSESTVLLERDRALARITELEADVDRLNAEVERLTAETEGPNAEHEAALTDLAAMTAQRDALSHAAVERDRLQGELDAVITERNALSGQFHQVNGERNELSTRIDAVTAERDELSGQLQTVSAERDDAQQRLAVVETQNREHTTRLGNVDQLNTENADLTSRLAVAEQARVDLEGQLEEVSEKWKSTTRQLAVFENVNGQLDDAVAARKTAEDQLRLANASLASVRARIGLSHDTIRGELSSLESSLVTTPALDEPVDAPAELGDNTTEISTADEASTDSFMSDSLIADEPATDSLAGDSFIGDSFANEHGLIDDVSLPDDSLVDIASTDTPEMPNLELDGFNSDDGFNHDVADVGEIEVPSFEDSGLTFDGGMDEADGYDVAGIEMDPRTLGGKTIGDMFGEDQTHLDNTSLPGSDVFDPAPTNFATPDPIGFSSDMAPPAERRREVLDPGGLDDGAFARYVVTSPDVVLLIDGDGAAGLGWPHLDVATRRSALVEYLGSLTADSGAAADVVFVRAVGDEDALPVSRAVRVRIADHPVAESPIFASIIDGYPHEWPIAIVTNEPSLLVEADGLGVATLSNDQLLDLFLDLNPED